MDSATRRRQMGMKGDEIAVMILYLDLCESYRQKDPATVQGKHKSQFIILKAFHVALEYLILCTIDLINLIEALCFAEETQSEGPYQNTILKHICIPIDDLQKRLSTQITGKDFQTTMSQIPTAFSTADALKVHDNFILLLKEYNQRMERNGDRKYIHDIRNGIAAHTDPDIDVYIALNNRINAERIRSIMYDTLDFVKNFLKTADPLFKELQGAASTTSS